jgi:hypothetical protein
MQVLFYLCPALVDWMSFFVSFAAFYAAGLRGLGMQECAWLGLSFQVAYMTSSLASGHVITHRNARGILIASTVVCGVSGAGVLAATGFGWLATGLLVFGMSMAWFFNSFQAFMRGDASMGSLKSSVALYTLSWCLGAALGNVTAGWLFRWGLWALILAVVFTTLLIVSLLMRPVSRRAEEPPGEGPVEHGTNPDYPVSGAYIAIGWLMIFTVTFVQRPLFTFLPPLFASQGIDSLWASLPLFMHMTVAALFGMAMVRYRGLLYRRTPFGFIQGGGVLALFAMWWWPTYWVCFAMLCLLGVYAGFVYYCAVYYASNSGRRSFNIGVNEALVGSGSIAGILLGEGWVRHSGITIDMYWICGAGLAVSIVAQLAAVRHAGSGIAKRQARG